MCWVPVHSVGGNMCAEELASAFGLCLSLCWQECNTLPLTSATAAAAVVSRSFLVCALCCVQALDAVKALQEGDYGANWVGRCKNVSAWLNGIISRALRDT